MRDAIKGIHHITALAKDAAATDGFFTEVLGLRRVKKTVNFDAPEIYHLYYADRVGRPGTVMTYFPFPNIAARDRGVGEIRTIVFSVPEGSLAFWEKHLSANTVSGVRRTSAFGEERLHFQGINDDDFALAEVAGDAREPWRGAGIPAEHAIRGFHCATMTLRDVAPTRALLEMMGYSVSGEENEAVRMRHGGGNGADIVELETGSDGGPARQGAGSVHHIAFAVENAEAQLSAREVLVGEGYSVTPVIDRDYFLSIYFRSPGGVLFEIATNDPGFARDEDIDNLGAALKLPRQHAHLREQLESYLPPLDG